MFCSWVLYRKLIKSVQYPVNQLHYFNLEKQKIDQSNKLLFQWLKRVKLSIRTMLILRDFERISSPSEGRKRPSQQTAAIFSGEWRLSWRKTTTHYNYWINYILFTAKQRISWIHFIDHMCWCFRPPHDWWSQHGRDHRPPNYGDKT